MKRIILHWTAGNNYPSSTDLERYHYLVDNLGVTHNGKFKPEANLNCKDGKYAQHCGGGNTGSIGIALCGMKDFKHKNNMGVSPISKIQFEHAMKLVAKICIKYNITIAPDTVMTHYEFGKSHPKSSSYGKIDVTFVPPYPWIEKDEVGKFIRSKIKWYQSQLKA